MNDARYPTSGDVKTMKTLTFAGRSRSQHSAQKILRNEECHTKKKSGIKKSIIVDCLPIVAAGYMNEMRELPPLYTDWFSAL